MGTLSNNRGNAAQLGLWYVNANNAPSNANANYWGSRPSPQTRRQSRHCPMLLNHPPVQSAFGLAANLRGCAGQFPLIQRIQVASSEDVGRTEAMRKRRKEAA